jgi:general secretion pathway protein D
MKTLFSFFCAAAIFSGALISQAQQRAGGFGGFGGFGGGAFGGNRGGGSTTTSAYNNNGSVGTATITVDPQTHNIIVSADEVTAEQISNVIANLDIPKPQVLIKVVFLEVQHNNDLDIGVEGGFTKGIGDNVTASAANVFGLAGANSVVTNFSALGQPLAAALTPNAGPNGFYQLVGSDYQVTLKAIATAGKAQVISRPSILARDGQLAEIVVGQSIYLPTGVAFTSIGGDTSSAIPTINGSYQNVGIQLDVTPFIGANNLIEMILEPQITAIDTSSPGQQIVGSSLFSGAVFAPNINKRSANTVVITPDAQPVVIGGLISNDKSSSVSKIPLLGDIPLLGVLFRATTKSVARTELLMFLTPHIVRAPSQLMPLGVSETSQMAAITNSISEEELNRLVDRLPLKKTKN